MQFSFQAIIVLGLYIVWTQNKNGLSNWLFLLCLTTQGATQVDGLPPIVEANDLKELSLSTDIDPSLDVVEVM